MNINNLDPGNSNPNAWTGDLSKDVINDIKLLLTLHILDHASTDYSDEFDEEIIDGDCASCD